MNNRKDSNANRFLLRQNTAHHQPPTNLSPPSPLLHHTCRCRCWLQPWALRLHCCSCHCRRRPTTTCRCCRCNRHCAAAATVTALPLQPSLRCRCNHHCAAATAAAAAAMFDGCCCVFVCCLYHVFVCTCICLSIFSCLYAGEVGVPPSLTSFTG
jgi:hypothetical protein